MSTVFPQRSEVEHINNRTKDKLIFLYLLYLWIIFIKSEQQNQIIINLLNLIFDEQWHFVKPSLLCYVNIAFRNTSLFKWMSVVAVEALEGRSAACITRYRLSSFHPNLQWVWFCVISYYWRLIPELTQYTFLINQRVTQLLTICQKKLISHIN